MRYAGFSDSKEFFNEVVGVITILNWRLFCMGLEASRVSVTIFLFRLEEASLAYFKMPTTTMVIKNLKDGYYCNSRGTVECKILIKQVCLHA